MSIAIGPPRGEPMTRTRDTSMGWDAYRSEVPTLLDAIGRTPLVRLQRVAPDGVELLAKVEWYGPTGSVKDRIYAAMLTKAEERGDLRPGMTVIECTTGNAGIACSAVAAIKGYACTIVMPEGMSDERKRMIAAYGAELELTPGAGTDIDLALARMREIVDADPGRYFFPGEFENPDNPEAQLASGRGDLGAVRRASGRRRRRAGDRRLDHRGGPGIEVIRRPRSSVRRGAQRMSAHHRAAMGDPRRARHR